MGRSRRLTAAGHFLLTQFLPMRTYHLTQARNVFIGAALFCLMLLCTLQYRWRNQELLSQNRVYTYLNPINYLSSNLEPVGRLGNHLFEAVSLFGLSRKLNRTFIYFIQNEEYEKQWNQTKKILPGLEKEFKVVMGNPPLGISVVDFPPVWYLYEDPEPLTSRKEKFLHLSGTLYQSWRYFPNIREDVLKLLSPPKRFSNLPESNENSKVTCIHIRRSDFITMKWFVADEHFTRKVIEFIHYKEYLKPGQSRTIVLFGEDQKFMKSIFPATIPHVVSENSREDDLLYSSLHCDTFFVSAPVSTFGWFMGYFSKGNNTYYTDIRHTDDALYTHGYFIPQDHFPPEWTPLKLDKKTDQVVATEY